MPTIAPVLSSSSEAVALFELVTPGMGVLVGRLTITCESPDAVGVAVGEKTAVAVTVTRSSAFVLARSVRLRNLPQSSMLVVCSRTSVTVLYREESFLRFHSSKRSFHCRKRSSTHLHKRFHKHPRSTFPLEMVRSRCWYIPEKASAQRSVARSYAPERDPQTHFRPASFPRLRIRATVCT